MDYPEEFLIGVQLFNRGDYFESHDAWEEMWQGMAGKDREFIQGLIQVAIGLCHYYNGNVVGAQRMYWRSRSYLQPFAPECFGVQVDDWLAALETCFAPVLAADPNRPIGLDIALVPPIVLNPAPATWPAIPAWVYDREAKRDEDEE